MTERLPVDPHHPDPAALARAAAVLGDGGLVAFPTETVYGLGAIASDATAARRVFEAKQRPPTDPLIVHGADTAAFHGLVAHWSAAATRLAERFWPGPLTLVLPRGAAVPDEVTAGGDSVGVRVPAHPVALALLRAVGETVAAPSANRFGRVSPTTADHVMEELEGRIELVLDGGPTMLGVESSVVDLTGQRPRLLRPGGVTLEDLTAELGEVDHEPRRSVPLDGAPDAPGQFLGHYAPRTPVVLVEGDDDRRDAVVELLGRSVDGAAALRLPDEPGAAAAALYSVLRRADAAGATVLVARTLDPGGLGRAVNDRLFRAAHGRVVVDVDAGAVAGLVRRLGL